jgi:hypothetical protein
MAVENHDQIEDIENTWQSELEEYLHISREYYLYA